ncbi:MAG: hypothetical protein JWM59_3534 [Verrucomicrobiales bacterium]|nr:hypothetical protein [Verrucomicrobiales bacterium]
MPCFQGWLMRRSSSPPRTGAVGRTRLDHSLRHGNRGTRERWLGEDDGGESDHGHHQCHTLCARQNDHCALGQPGTACPAAFTREPVPRTILHRMTSAEDGISPSLLFSSTQHNNVFYWFEINLPRISFDSLGMVHGGGSHAPARCRREFNPRKSGFPSTEKRGHGAFSR